MFVSATAWNDARPHVLVVACSDGRFESQLDEFLQQELSLSRYDRLYLAGGPGALAGSGFEYLRVDLARRECRFLIEAHNILRVILVFHSGSADGPDAAMCADYRRKLPGRTIMQLREQQEADAQEVIHYVLSWPSEMRVDAYRAEVGSDCRIRFVYLGGRGPAGAPP